MARSWALERDLVSCDDQELADLIGVLLEICSLRHAFDSPDERRRHEYRLMRCLFERYARGDQTTLDYQGADSR